MSEVLVWFLTVGLFGLGLAGVFIPVLPGVGLVFAGILLYAILTDFTQISVWFVIWSGIIALAGWLIEYAGAVIGARFGGGGKFTLLGTVVGAGLGLLVGGPIGLLAGVVLGALTGALYEGKTVNKAGKAALFSIMGVVGAKLMQAIITVGLIVVFLLTVLFKWL